MRLSSRRVFCSQVMSDSAAMYIGWELIPRITYIQQDAVIASASVTFTQNTVVFITV